MDNITKVLVSITTVALIATLVASGAQTATVISSAGKAFSGSLTAAEGK